jgi:hypothetical protein
MGQYLLPHPSRFYFDIYNGGAAQSSLAMPRLGGLPKR